MKHHFERLIESIKKGSKLRTKFSKQLFEDGSLIETTTDVDDTGNIINTESVTLVSQDKFQRVTKYNMASKTVDTEQSSELSPLHSQEGDHCEKILEFFEKNNLAKREYHNHTFSTGEHYTKAIQYYSKQLLIKFEIFDYKSPYNEKYKHLVEFYAFNSYKDQSKLVRKEYTEYETPLSDTVEKIVINYNGEWVTNKELTNGVFKNKDTFSKCIFIYKNNELIQLKFFKYKIPELEKIYPLLIGTEQKEEFILFTPETKNVVRRNNVQFMDELFLK